MDYRREIDGLRTVAVLPVIAFHAGLGPFHGGFAGVDVFFVISGYLITAILLRDLDRGRFSLWTFYERRARRILPALFVVVAACVPFAWAWMPADAFAAFGRSVVAVGLFGSNILFWREAGYFEAAAEAKPLLHTWSLAVEEQYYLLFPPLLAWLWHRARGGLFWIVAAIALASFALAQWSVAARPDAAFYLAPTRAWELLAGSLAAMLAVSHPAPGRQGPAALGLAMIFAALLLYDHGTPFPSVYTLLPVAGTVLVLRYGQAGTWVARLLSGRAMVGIGLISYSAYLWHQPLFAFARIRSLDDPAPWLMALLGLAALGLAWATWAWVEQPFRVPPAGAGRVAGKQPGGFLTRPRILGGSALGLGALVGLGLLLPGAERGVPAMPTVLMAQDSHICAMNDRVSQARLATCLAEAKDRPKVFLIGDSHARAGSAALRAVLAAEGRTLISFSHTGCYPIPGTARLPVAGQQGCRDLMALAWATLAATEGAPVILFARWTLNLQGTRFDNGEGGVEHGAPVETRVLQGQGDLASHTLDVLTRLDRTHPVTVLGPFPEAGWDVPTRLAKMAMFDTAAAPELSTSYAVQTRRMAPATALMSDLAARGVDVVPLTPLFCDTLEKGRCANAWPGKVFYSDDDHPSPMAAGMIARVAVAALPPTPPFSLGALIEE